MQKSRSLPLKITATLLDGRINSADGIIMFDSILYHAWFLKHAPHVLEGMGEYDDRGYNIGLPLFHLSDNRWAASRGIYTETEVNVEYYHKRSQFLDSIRTNYLAADKGIFSASEGIYKSYRMPNTIRTVKDSRIVFYCLGRQEDIEELLNLIVAVGKKASMGWGLVEKWDVEEIEEDYSYMHPDYGLMRPTPIEDTKLTGYPIRQYAIRPPYWKQKNYKLCYVPIPIPLQ